MHRKDFLKTIAGATAVLSLGSLKSFADRLSEQELKMPVLFVGHGSPMNAIEDNEFTKRWRQMGKEIVQPKAVLCISAHWLTKGTFVTAMQTPKTIHDFGGFPKQLNETKYPAPGSPAVAKDVKSVITKTNVEMDHDWGLDHGTWSITKQMYPNANIPVLQLSIDYSKPPQWHYDLGKDLAELRKKGVLIIGSGNMVHNLGMAAFDKINESGYGFDWTHEMNSIFKKKITDGDHQALINYESLSKSAKLAVPTPDHYYPMLYSLALQEKNEQPVFFNDKAVAGSLTMTSVQIG